VERAPWLTCEGCVTHKGATNTAATQLAAAALLHSQKQFSSSYITETQLGVPLVNLGATPSSTHRLAGSGGRSDGNSVASMPVQLDCGGFRPVFFQKQASRSQRFLMAECYTWNLTRECTSTLLLWWLGGCGGVGGGGGGMLHTRASVCGERCSQVGFDMVECILIEIQRRRFIHLGQHELMKRPPISRQRFTAALCTSKCKELFCTWAVLAERLSQKETHQQQNENNHKVRLDKWAQK
jgi:hypothetical protein